MIPNAFKVWSLHSNPDIEYEKYFNILLKKLVDIDNFSFIRISDGEYHLFKWGISFDNSVDVKNIERTKNTLDKVIEFGSKDGLIIAPQWSTPNDNEYRYLIDGILKNLIGTYHASLFSWATVTGRMKDFFNTIKSRNIILVGPIYLRDLKIHQSFIETIHNRAWDKQDLIEDTLDKEIEKYNNPVILYCCSWSGKMAIVRNYFKYGNKITQIDLGANLNPYVGVPIRAWHSAVYDDWVKK